MAKAKTHPRFVSRSAWGAETPTRTPVDVPARERLGVAVHWNGGAIAQPEQHRDCAQLVRQIQAEHQHGNGWSDAAYSFAVCQHGYVFRLRGWTWDQFANGTTTDASLHPDATGYANRDWYSAIVLIGEGQEPTQAAVDALALVVRRARARGAGRRVVPHRGFHATACPGDTLAAVATKWDRHRVPTHARGRHRAKTPKSAAAAAPTAAPAPRHQLATRSSVRHLANALELAVHQLGELSARVDKLEAAETKAKVGAS